MELDEKLIKIINKNSQVVLEKEDIVDDLDLMERLGFDSMSFVQLVVDIEEEFKIEIPEDKLLIEYMRYYKNIRKSVLEQLK